MCSFILLEENTKLLESKDILDRSPSLAMQGKCTTNKIAKPRCAFIDFRTADAVTSIPYI